ncbi:MAG: TolC family protein [Leadbetterella sp.]|nr:TolC family protein [Leadbetterella sp.]
MEQRNRVKTARLNVKNNEIAAGAAKTQLEQAIDQAAIHLQSALERCETLERQVQAFGESFRAAEIRFNQGVGNSIDYLTAKNNSDRANINLISAQYEAVLRSRILDFYRGETAW